MSRALDRVAGEFPGLRLSLLTTERGAEEVDATHLDVRVPRAIRRVHRGPLRLFSEQLAAPFVRGDLLHFFDLSGPALRRSMPFTATVHDAAVVRGGDLSGARRAYKSRLQPWAARRARGLVAVSQFAKDEAVRHLHADPERVTVIHSGPGLLETSGAAIPGQDGEYFLYVGGLAANKNLPFLVRAFEQAGVGARLKLVGRPAPGADELMDAVRASPVGDRIDVVSDADDAEVDRLYRGAVALLHPSLYEGFGFTPLEAMARGCPVLESDIPPLQEVSGDGAFVLPLDEPVWADAIRRVSSEDELRADLRRRGEATAARYSWDTTARSLCELFLRT